MDEAEAIARIQGYLTEARLKYFEIQPSTREAYYEGRTSAFSDALKIVKGEEVPPEKLPTIAFTLSVKYKLCIDEVEVRLEGED